VLPPHRIASLAALSFALAVGCSGSKPAPSLVGRAPAAGVLATFAGVADPARGTLTVEVLPAGGGSALTAWEPDQDGAPGSGGLDTFELVTVPQAQYPGVEPGGCGGGVDAYRGDVTIRSFFRNQTLENVHAEITEVTGGFEGCANAPSQPGASAAYGLWAYPAVAPGEAATATWRFRFQTSQRFTFRGRIMADLGAPAHLAGAPELDWTPSVLDARRSFQRVATTKAHLVWNGSTFADALGGVTFAAQGTPGSTFSPVPGAAHSSGAAYFVASPATGGDVFDMSGDFTACVKFKPGANPVWGSSKVLVAKGEPEWPQAGANTEGWALVQSGDAYSLVYRTGADASELIVRRWEIGWSPESAAYDYLCGGRAGNLLHVQAHGATEGAASDSELGTFAAAGADLSLAVGAYPDGTRPASDAGIYEVILDGRAASPAVMKEIVDAAEGRNVPGSPATFVPPASAASACVGRDGATYTLPPYATPPLSYDGTGLLGAGQILRYLHPLAENTNLSGYCAGAEVVATGDWASVGGGAFGVDVWSSWGWDTMWLELNPLALHNSFATATATSWVTGSGGAHVFLACAAAGGGVTLYVDGAPVGSAGSFDAGSLVDLSTTDRPRQLHVGEGGGTVLAGARIRRVFLCPTAVAADCQ
jgi:hypothetical protein